MEIEEMRRTIQDAVDKKEVSLRDLGHPGTIRRIIDCKGSVREETIKSAYSKLKVKNPDRIKSGRASSSAPRGLKEPTTPEKEPIVSIEQEPNAPIEQNAPIVSVQYVSIEEFQFLKNEMNSLQEQIKALQGQSASKPPNTPRPQVAHKYTVLGFSISIHNTYTDGNKYKKHYAVKRIKGKLHRIYLGNRPEDAETKIKQYCEKRNIELKKLVAQ